VVNHFARRRAAGRPRTSPARAGGLRQIASGRTTKEIATIWASARRPRTHRRRLMEKLDRYSVAELTQYAVMEGLIALEIPV
jgi:FixJ family two-component response regulator